MSYAGISVREALDKLNAPTGGWYLPQVQRQYVWGARHESEGYVCLLLDSLLRRYPIGGVVLWETSKEVPYREFLKDYAPGQYAHQVDKGRWAAEKSLVYDGQQRLQTLYSVLRHRFNGRVLHFDLLFDDQAAESDETGFLFRGADEEDEARYLRMTRLASTVCDQAEKVALEEEAIDALAPDKAGRLRIRKHIGALWDIFVDTNIKSIAYFAVKADSPKQVNEVFRRLNTGGVALSQIDLVLSKIKAVQSDYEEQLWKLADKIQKATGIDFGSANVLQFFHLLVKETTRMDEDRLAAADIKAFQQVLGDDTLPFIEVFKGYLHGMFRINHYSIVWRWLAVLPIAVFLTARKRGGHKWRIRELTEADLLVIHQYFLLSQFCDWNTQTMVNRFSSLAAAAGEKGAKFPLPAIKKVAIEKNRTGAIHEYQFLWQPWLATKVLMPNREYVFHEQKPQVDHIFPVNLKGMNDAYKEAVDVLWNLQPMPAEVNNYKRARHPKEFFGSEDGAKYFGDYDFVPKLNSPVWDDHLRFIKQRKAKMEKQLEDRYGLVLKPDSDAA
jgi:hypothetical protein